MELDEVRGLLDAPAAAALLTYGADGSADVSPVWFRAIDGAFEVVVAEGDPKLPRLRRDPRAVLTIFEAAPPFRGVKVAAPVELDPDPDAVREARLEICARYLGPERGPAFVASRGPGVVVRLPSADAKVWGQSPRLPD